MTNQEARKLKKKRVLNDYDDEMMVGGRANTAFIGKIFVSVPLPALHVSFFWLSRENPW